MDPYLEEPGLWPDVHHRLVSGISEHLNAQLRPSYYTWIRERVYLADESERLIEREIREARIDVIHRIDQSVVAVIEIRTPANKTTGSPAHESFVAKRDEVLASSSHFVEIDLLRGGDRSVSFNAVPHEYRVLLSRADARPSSDLWPIRLDERLPVVPVPLQGGDPVAPLDLQQVLGTAYDRAAYELEVDYRQDPPPPPIGRYAEWMNRLLRERGLR